MIAICPKCGKEIEHLTCREFVIEYSNVTLSEWEGDYTLGTDTCDTETIWETDLKEGIKPLVYGCPYCESILADDYEKAIEILKGKDIIEEYIDETKKQLEVKNE